MRIARHGAVQRVAYWLSTALVLGVLGAYLWAWTQGNWPMLTDPNLQNSDARTSIFPFHRYDSGALADDPIANEMLALVPIGVHAMYRVLVPMTDVFVAPKIVQALALAVLVYAAVVMARSRRAGLGAAALLLFAVLHDWFAVYRVAGGLPRAFGFPCFALWLSGVVANRPWVRRAAPVLAALTYPSVMNMILAAEGLYTLRGLGKTRHSVVGRRLLRYFAVVGVCFVAVLPAVVGGEDRGPIHTLEQAKKEPAFGKTGRLWILPFAEPTKVFGEAFVDQMKPRGKSFSNELRKAYKEDWEAYGVAIFALLLVFAMLRFCPTPWLALAFFCGSAILYVLSRALAFQLYSPERYYSFGMRMASITLIVVILSHAWFWLRPRAREIFRNLTIVGFILLIWGCTGTGVVKLNGMTIDQRRDKPLYEYIAKLPESVRFASHPMDGDGIPYYSARATMGAFETLQPWFTGSWRRQRARAEDTLRALYSTDPKVVFDYAHRNGVTHFLIDTRRYRKDFRRRSASFDPFTGYAKNLLSGVRLDDLVFANVPKQAVVFRRGSYLVVDVTRLEKVLGGGGK